MNEILVLDWVQTTNGIITLITGLCGLVMAGISGFFAIKSWIKLCKEKSAKDVWSMIMSMADAAIKEAEKSMASGADKKETVIEAVKEGCKAAGLNIDDFMDQLSAYIDQCIKFYNDMSSATPEK